MDFGSHRAPAFVRLSKLRELSIVLADRVTPRTLHLTSAHANVDEITLATALQWREGHYGHPFELSLYDIMLCWCFGEDFNIPRFRYDAMRMLLVELRDDKFARLDTAILPPIWRRCAPESLMRRLITELVVERVVKNVMYPVDLERFDGLQGFSAAVVFGMKQYSISNRNYFTRLTESRWQELAPFPS